MSACAHSPRVILQLVVGRARARCTSPAVRVVPIPPPPSSLLPRCQIVKEIQETIPLEFNFDREVAFMRVIRANLRAHGFDGLVVVPRAVVDLCTPRMIVMEVGGVGTGGGEKGRVYKGWQGGKGRWPRVNRCCL